MIEKAEWLEGKVALIAGVGSGMGGATARLLASAGADVGAIDLTVEPAQTVVKEVIASGRRGHLAIADLREQHAVRGAVDAIEEALGGIDILVTVAGGMTLYQNPRPFEMWELSDWDEIIDRNLRYVTIVSREVLPRIVRRGKGGSVVFVASISGTTSSPNSAAYGAAKAGLINFTRSIALEYATPEVRVNCVAPGLIDTDTVRERRGLKEAKSFDFIPLGRPGMPEDVAGAILFLTSSMAKYITGQTLVVDGGLSVKFPLPW